MDTVHGRSGSGVLNVFKAHGYLIITSIILCVLAASAYLFFLSAQYKVQLKLTVIGSQRSSDDVIKDLRSIGNIQKAVHALPLQVRYYHRDGMLKKTELYGDSLPIRFVLQKGSVFNSSTKVVAQMIDDGICEVDENNITTNVPLDHPVRYSALNYMVMKGPAFRSTTEPVTIKFSNNQDLTESFSRALEAKVLDDRTFELSVKVDNIQKGQDFLNKLIEIFNSRNVSTGIAKKVVIAGYNETLAKVSDSITILKAKAQKYQQQQQTTANIIQTKPATPLKEKQKIALDVLAALKPYVMRPVGVFVLIPDGYDVNDSHIEQLIAQFNETALDKQRALRQTADAADADVKELDIKLTALKQDMLSSIANRERQINGTRQLTAAKTQSELDDTLARINALIDSKQQEYNNLLQHSEARPVAATPRLTVVENTAAQGITFSRTLLVYFIALMAGLMLPVILLAISELLNHPKRMAM